jgi:hypothetical protein
MFSKIRVKDNPIIFGLFIVFFSLIVSYQILITDKLTIINEIKKETKLDLDNLSGDEIEELLSKLNIDIRNLKDSEITKDIDYYIEKINNVLQTSPFDKIDKEYNVIKIVLKNLWLVILMKILPLGFVGFIIKNPYFKRISIKKKAGVFVLFCIVILSLQSSLYVLLDRHKEDIDKNEYNFVNRSIETPSYMIKGTYISKIWLDILYYGIIGFLIPYMVVFLLRKKIKPETGHILSFVIAAVLLSVLGHIFHSHKKTYNTPLSKLETQKKLLLLDRHSEHIENISNASLNTQKQYLVDHYVSKFSDEGMTEQEKIKRAHQKVNKLLDEIPNSETLKEYYQSVQSISVFVVTVFVFVLMYHYFKTHNTRITSYKNLIRSIILMVVLVYYTQPFIKAYGDILIVLVLVSLLGMVIETELQGSLRKRIMFIVIVFSAILLLSFIQTTFIRMALLRNESCGGENRRKLSKCLSLQKESKCVPSALSCYECIDFEIDEKNKKDLEVCDPEIIESFCQKNRLYSSCLSKIADSLHNETPICDISEECSEFFEKDKGYPAWRSMSKDELCVGDLTDLSDKPTLQCLKALKDIQCPSSFEQCKDCLKRSNTGIEENCSTDEYNSYCAEDKFNIDYLKCSNQFDCESFNSILKWNKDNNTCNLLKKKRKKRRRIGKLKENTKETENEVDLLKKLMENNYEKCMSGRQCEEYKYKSYDNISKDPCASYLEKSASNPRGVLRCCQKNKQRGNQCDMKIIQSDYGDECLCRVYDDKMKREKIENEIRVLNQIEID